MKIFLGICVVFALLYLISYLINIPIILYKIIAKKYKKDDILNLIPFWHYLNTNYGDEKEDKQKKVLNSVLIICIIIGLFNWFVYWADLGEEKIGAFIEKSYYITYQYVNLFPEDSKSKNYRVIGEFEVEHRDIKLKRFAFDNKRIISVDDQDKFNFGFNEKIDVVDSNGEKWYFEILDSKPTYEQIKNIFNYKQN